MNLSSRLRLASRPSVKAIYDINNKTVCRSAELKERNTGRYTDPRCRNDNASSRCLSPFCLNLRFSSGIFTVVIIMTRSKSSKSDGLWGSSFQVEQEVLSCLTFCLLFFLFEKKSNYPCHDRLSHTIHHGLFSLDVLPFGFRPTVSDNYMLGFPHACFPHFSQQRAGIYLRRKTRQISHNILRYPI